MLKLRKSRGKFKNNRVSRIGVLISFLVTFGLLGALVLKQVWATGDEEPTLTIISVSQYGEPIDPTYDEYLYNENTWDWGDYYYSVANNTDSVTLELLVDGLADGKSYRMWGDDRILTSQDNGHTIQKEVRPYVSMGDSVTYDEHGEVDSYSTWTNEYHAQAYLEDVNTYETFGWVSAVLRPRAVGSSNLEILSVKQDGVDVVLDTVGRQVKDYYVMQTINEYQLLDFTKPVDIACKLKNLHEGWEYSGSIGNEYFHFVADSEEISDTVSVNLNAVNKHTELRFYIYAYGPNGEYESMEVPLYFRIVDERFVPLGDIVITGISQGGSNVAPNINGNTYTFRVNDVEDLTIDYKVTSAASDVTYYVGRNMWANDNGGNYHPTEWSTATGSELLAGTSITMAARMDESEHSPFSLNMGISMSENNFNTLHLYYGEYDPDSWWGNNIEFDFYVDDTIPRYTVAYGYANFPDEEESAYLGMVDARFHDENNPLKVRIDGTNYVNDREYTINISVKRGEEDFYSQPFTATGAQLNSGHTIVITGLTLTAPEFDAESGEATIWSLSGNSGYDFTIDVNGLKQTAFGVFYQYAGWMDTMITFADGSVNATPGRNGMGGSPYVDYGYSNLSSAALDEERRATLHYLGSGFEDDVTYNYALYFRGSYVDGGLIGDQKLVEGTISGKELKDNTLKVTLGEPNENSGIMMYDLVIKKGNKLVLIVRDEIEIVNEPRIESFTINNDADDYAQTGKANYTVAKDVDVVGTLTGANFDNDTTYRLGVEYGTFVYDDERGYSDYVELEDLAEIISVTGAELNNGYAHTVHYDERFAGEGVDNVEVFYYFPDNEYEYLGHAIHLRFVEPEEVGNTEGGFHIDEDGEIHNDEHSDQPEEVPVDIKTPGDVDVIVNGTSLTVVSRKPTLVIGLKNGHYRLVEEIQGIDNDGERTNSYDMSGYEEIKVVLKGDIDMKGSLNARDSAKLYYYLLSADNPNHRDLSELELLIADINKNGGVTARDASLLDYALLSADNPSHRDLAW